MNYKTLEIGDSIVFKERVRDFFSRKFVISGWQGRIKEIVPTNFYLEDGSRTLEYHIELDSITLRNLPKEYIFQYIEMMIDFRYYHAYIQNFTPTDSRDTIEDVGAAWQYLEQKYQWEEKLEESRNRLYDAHDEEDEYEEEDEDEYEEYDDQESKKLSENSITRAELWIINEEGLISNQHNYKIGDSVVFKQGVKDWKDEDIDMSGWQGRIIDIDDPDLDQELPNDISMEVELDSITLLQLSDEYIRDRIQNLRDFRYGSALVDEFEPAEPRDTRDELVAVRLELDKKYDYSSIFGFDFREPEMLLRAETFNYN